MYISSLLCLGHQLMSEGWQSFEHIPLTTDAPVTFPDIWAMFSTHSSLLLPLISMTFLYLFPHSLLLLGTKSVTGVGSQWTLNPVAYPSLFLSLSFSLSHKKLTENWKTIKQHCVTPFSYILTGIQWFGFKRKLLRIVTSEYFHLCSFFKSKTIRRGTSICYRNAQSTHQEWKWRLGRPPGVS